MTATASTQTRTTAYTTLIPGTSPYLSTRYPETTGPKNAGTPGITQMRLYPNPRLPGGRLSASMASSAGW